MSPGSSLPLFHPTWNYRAYLDLDPQNADPGEDEWVLSDEMALLIGLATKLALFFFF